MPRDDFPIRIKETLAKRVAYHCSNPDCDIITTGPHTDSSKYINLGVASHITAASPNGPRFDPNLSKQERSAIENGIWLCQKCSKLIDSDEIAYTIERLKNWKITSERKIDDIINSNIQLSFYPQPANARHTPIPKIAYLTYDDARTKMIESGWQPVLNRPSYQSENPTLIAGNGDYFWTKGFHEIVNACPTGLAYCTFMFRDVYKNNLIIVTAGETYEERNVFTRVWAWYLNE